MIQELNQAIETYKTKWQELVSKRSDKAAYEDMKPMAAGWKTEDLASFDTCFTELRAHCDQIHLVWLNERFITTMILRDEPLAWNIQIVKLMQRRPNSTDAIGLDHIDFYAPDVGNAETMHAKEPDLKWSNEVNGHCKWTSLWFEGTEAKLRRESVIDVSIAELSEANKRIMHQKT